MNYEKHNDLSRAAKDWHTGDCRKVQHKLDGTIYEVWRIGFPNDEDPQENFRPALKALQSGRKCLPGTPEIPRKSAISGRFSTSF